MRTRLVTKKTIVTIMCLKQTFMIDLSKVKKKKKILQKVSIFPSHSLQHFVMFSQWVA